MDINTQIPLEKPPELTTSPPTPTEKSIVEHPPTDTEHTTTHNPTTSTEQTQTHSAPSTRPSTLHVPGQDGANDGALPNGTRSSTPAPSIRPPSAIHAPTQIVYSDPDFSQPPPLNYTLRTRKGWIAFFWTLIALDCIAMPIALYFGLWYGTNLSHNAVFSISTGLLGTVSIVEYFIRFHRLWKKGSTCRVIGARRFYLDWFHWNLSIAWIAVMIELIVGTVPHEPPIRLLAMPVPSMVFAFGVQMLIIDVMRFAGMKSPVRISSLPRGVPLRPGIYSIIEDIIAVDGSGGTEYRQRLNLRYQASRHFRMMLHRLTLFWAGGALGTATLTTILIFTLGRDAAYVVGWTIPFIWAGIWAIITTYWVKYSLKVEYATWGDIKWKP